MISQTSKEVSVSKMIKKEIGLPKFSTERMKDCIIGFEVFHKNDLLEAIEATEAGEHTIPEALGYVIDQDFEANMLVVETAFGTRLVHRKKVTMSAEEQFRWDRLQMLDLEGSAKVQAMVHELGLEETTAAL